MSERPARQHSAADAHQRRRCGHRTLEGPGRGRTAGTGQGRTAGTGAGADCRDRGRSGLQGPGQGPAAGAVLQFAHRRHIGNKPAC